MLNRILNIQGVGLLHDARGGSTKLDKRTLIYGGNGRGKSTLASVLRSLAKGDGRLIEERVTVDATNSVRVALQFDSGHPVTYEHGSWSERRPEVLVYDSEFVFSNVHSGVEVTADHRKNLLDFALGDSAVQARSSEDAATKAQQAASSTIKTLTAQLQVHAGATTVAVFRRLRPHEDLQGQKVLIKERILAAGRVELIQQQKMLSPVAVPSGNITEIFELLDRSLDDIHADAEAAVQAHVEAFGDPSLSRWLSNGQHFDDATRCPYCGQGTEGIDLIKMYKSHFNEDFRNLRKDVDAAIALVVRLAQGEEYKFFKKTRESNNALVEQWKPYVQLEALTDDRDEFAVDSLGSAVETLTRLLARKEVALTDVMGAAGDLSEVERLWGQYLQLFTEFNELVEAANSDIAGFKERLKGEDLTVIQAELDKLELIESRVSPEVQALVTALESAEVDLKDAEQTKKAARTSLTDLMTRTLTAYRTNINSHLSNLGAYFAIDEIRTNYMGGAPRTDYGITLRGTSIKLVGGLPSFATALSEGDKRTMAFAFFVASTLSDPDLADKIVVVDDPVSSLDRSRRSYTIEVLVEIAAKSNQLVVLAHDALFLRDLKAALTRSRPNDGMSTFEIARAENEYSTFGSFDVDRECESPYYTNYRTVDEYVSGTSSKHREAATSLRLVLEGYLHRRYPGKISANLMLGQAVDQISSAQPPSPLVHAKILIDELRVLNLYAGKFHHDTNANYASVIADPAEVRTYARRVLDLVHGAGL
jgi:wobble nucleotide-excising tRNase